MFSVILGVCFERQSLYKTKILNSSFHLLVFKKLELRIKISYSKKLRMIQRPMANKNQRKIVSECFFPCYICHACDVRCLVCILGDWLWGWKIVLFLRCWCPSDTNREIIRKCLILEHKLKRRNHTLITLFSLTV